MAFYKPGADSQEMRYLLQRRAALGGFMPLRVTRATAARAARSTAYARFALEADGKEMSTTMALVRMLGNLLKDPGLGQRIVPIVADEARTFGMANLFRQVGIYSSQGQLYEPEDIGSMLYYREAKDGQILEEGITEAGAIRRGPRRRPAYSVHGMPMLPFYIYYSMFGFQRVGDLIWAAADQRARGFLVGATSGRTTLGGEGLQHQDGTSHLVAATMPNCVAYDPAYAYELAVIVEDGMRRMLERGEDVFYYVTRHQRKLRAARAAAQARRRHPARHVPPRRRPDAPQVRLLAAGPILKEVIAAAGVAAGTFRRRRGGVERDQLLRAGARRHGDRARADRLGATAEQPMSRRR